MQHPAPLDCAAHPPCAHIADRHKPLSLRLVSAIRSAGEKKGKHGSDGGVSRRTRWAGGWLCRGWVVEGYALRFTHRGGLHAQVELPRGDRET